MNRFFCPILVAFAIMFSFVGCYSSSVTGGLSSGNKDDLQSLGVAYHSYHDRNGKGPDSVDDLINMLTDPAKQQDFANSTAAKKLKSGEFVLNPRIQFSKAKDLSNIPLIYEKKVPSEGGVVVLGDATAKEMTAAEFQQLDRGDEARADQN